MHAYKGPGRYIAICNKANFDGHYVKRFEVPTYASADVYAGWWFLNEEDGGACLVAVYPEEIFSVLKEQS